jgi:uncharacterized protein (TIGR02594 family)
VKLPKKYEWLLVEPGPKMLQEFLRIYGTTEVPGEDDNPTILEWAKETGLQRDYRHDATAWCGLAAAVVAKRAGKELPPNPLWALNWATFGKKVTDGAKLGDILVFKRNGGGHVALYVGEDDECYHCLGGNQADTVNIVRKAKNRVYAIRRPIYINQPANVRKVILSSEGDIDSREA